jgi:hypothetical protein
MTRLSSNVVNLDIGTQKSRSKLRDARMDVADPVTRIVRVCIWLVPSRRTLNAGPDFAKGNLAQNWPHDTPVE